MRGVRSNAFGSIEPVQPPAIALVDADEVQRMRNALDALHEDDAEAVGKVHEKRTRQALFAAAYVDTFDRGAALRIAGVNPATYSHWRSEPAFRTLCEYCDELIRERVAGEVYRRAVIGTEQGIWHQGRRVGTERKYSDRMLELLAKRVDPAWADDGRVSAPETNTGAMVARILADDALRDVALALADAAATASTTRVLDVPTAGSSSGEAQPAGG